MQRLSIQKGHAFILVYSVCSRQSLEELRPIWQLIKEIKAEELSSIPVMLGEFFLTVFNFQNVLTLFFVVGNKIDEPAELRELSHAEGTAQAGEWGVQFMETSAKTNHNVTELFQVKFKFIKIVLKLFNNRKVNLNFKFVKAVKFENF